MTHADLPWQAHRPLDAARVSRVVDEQFPDLAPSRARYLDEGWDSEVYEVAAGGDAWIFRFPKREEVAMGQAVERALLPRLERALPIAVPRLSRLGRPCAEFPFAFLGYRKLPGVPATHVDPSRVDVAACGAQLAEFLGVLHAWPVEDALAAGVRREESARGHERSERHRRLVDEAEPALGRDRAARVRAFLARHETPLPPPEGRLVHYDVGDPHLLLEPDGSRITGVIDWGDVAVADPAVDFAGLWQWMGRPMLDRVLSLYPLPVDPALVDRARLGAVFASLAGAWYGVRGGRPEFVTWGVRGLENALPPT